MKTCCNANQTRRTFLRGAGLTLAGFGLHSLFPTPFVRYAHAAGGDGRFMFIFLRGGNDGLNAVIPHGDPDYNPTNRPTLYISPGDSIDLGNGFASLHPALEDLMEPLNAGDLAIVHRVGYENSSHSHFDGQRVWENGDPQQKQLFEGWLYRTIQETALDQGVALPVMSVQGTRPLLLRGDVSYVNVANPDTFDYLHDDPKRSKYADAWRGLALDVGGMEPYRPLLSDVGLKLVDTLDEYRSWDQQNWDPKDPNSGWSLFPVNDATNPDDPSGPNGKKFATSSYDFFRSLKLATLALLESDGLNDNGTRITGLELNGFDTHTSQGRLNGTQPRLLNWLGYGLKSVRIALSGAANDPRSYPGVWNRTVVATMSEFGRTSKENGSIGTDHANASCMFVEGGTVHGGLYNLNSVTWPSGSMFGVRNRYLSPRTDYRSVFWEIMRDHMGTSPSSVETVFPGYTAAGLAAQEPGIIQV
jgi:uncharacterized protein (DUF1501 family)